MHLRPRDSFSERKGQWILRPHILMLLQQYAAVHTEYQARWRIIS